jgi:hypothetical protein
MFQDSLIPYDLAASNLPQNGNINVHEFGFSLNDYDRELVETYIESAFRDLTQAFRDALKDSTISHYCLTVDPFILAAPEVFRDPMLLNGVFPEIDTRSSFVNNSGIFNSIYSFKDELLLQLNQRSQKMVSMSLEIKLELSDRFFSRSFYSINEQNKGILSFLAD